MSDGQAAGSAGLRCALCHADIGVDDVGSVCPGCGTRLHEECAAQLGRCPTIGCAHGAVAAPVALDEKKAAPPFVLYSPNQVLIVSVLFSVVGGGVLMGLNACRLGRRALGAFFAILGAAVVTTLLIGSAIATPDRDAPARAVGLLLALALRQVAAIAQGPAYQAHLEAGGRRGSTWAAVGVSLLALVLLFVPVIGGLVALEEALPDAIHERAFGDDPVGAERLCSVQLALDPEDGWTYSIRGWVRGRQGRHDEALRDHARALRFAPTDGWTFARRAHTLLEQGRDPQAALDDVDRALALDRDVAWFWSLRGSAHEQLHDPVAALGDFEQVLRLDSDDTFARARRAAITGVAEQR